VCGGEGRCVVGSGGVVRGGGVWCGGVVVGECPNLQLAISARKGSYFVSFSEQYGAISSPT